MMERGASRRLADTWIEAQEAYLLAATNYQDAKQDRTDACTAVQGSINHQQEADDAANQATTTKKNVYATVEEELKAISSEKAMIEMLLKMLGRNQHWLELNCFFGSALGRHGGPQRVWDIPLCFGVRDPNN
jgi:hypothetical protein